MEVAAIAETDLWEVWTESVLGTLAPSMHFHLQALFCHVVAVSSFQFVLGSKPCTSRTMNLAAGKIGGAKTSIFWQAYFEWTLRQQTACKAFMKELIAKNVVPADSWPNGFWRTGRVATFPIYSYVLCFHFFLAGLSR